MLFKAKINKLNKMMHAFILICSVFFSMDALSFNSQAQYENYVTNKDGISYINDMNSCNDLHKIFNIFTSMSDLYNVVMPTRISGDDNATEAQRATIFMEIIGPIMARAFLYTAALMVPGIDFLIMGAIATEIVIMLDVCTNYYIMQPYEYANYKKGGTDYYKWERGANGEYSNNATCAATAYDILYYFQCDDSTAANYSKSICDRFACDDSSKPVYQQLGCTSQTTVANCKCDANNKPDPYCYKDGFRDVAGKLVFAYDGPFFTRLFNYRSRFSPKNIYSVNPGSDNERSMWISKSPVWLTSYYNLDQNTGSIEACLISPLTFLPVKIGCAPIAPPLEEKITNNNFSMRCIYLTSPRKDLHQLGSDLLNETIVTDSYVVPIGRFLKSEMHFTSVMVGCVKDMLVRIFMSPTAAGHSSFLASVQGMLRSFVLAVLTLYVALVGIKIILSQGQLRRSDYIMFLLKFAIVVMLNGTEFWYQADPNGGPGTGIFPALVYGAEDLANMFIGALSTNDALNFCNLTYNGAQLLSERVVNLPSGVVTSGYTGVKLSVWDMLDCKLINYLNVGSCHYSGMGVLSTLMIGLGASLFTSILFAIVLVLFIAFTVGLIFKFARITVLAAIVLSTLVLVSPIFVCFILFDKTKQIFQAWFRSLIGYMLYPAFLMAYLTLIIITLDSVYYGDLNISSVTTQLTSNGRTTTRAAVLNKACEHVDSLFCSTVVTMNGDPCANDISNYDSQYTDTMYILGIPIHYLKVEIANLYTAAAIRVLMFAMLFYFLMDASISFLASLLGVDAMSQIASSGVLSSIMKGLTSKLFASIKKAMKGERNNE